MMRFPIALFALTAVPACLAVGTVEVVFSYKLNGVQKREVITLGAGGKTTPDYDMGGSSDPVGDFEWSFESTSGYDFRIGISRGVNAYRIGRRAGSLAFRYTPTSGGYYGRLYFGETYQLDLSSDLGIADTITEAFVSSTPYDGKKITNMTDSDIAYGYPATWSDITIPKGSAVFVTDLVSRFAMDNWNAAWEVHSEQDWGNTFTSYVYRTYSCDFPHFANLIIYKPSTKPPIHQLTGALVLGDTNQSSSNLVLHGSSGYPLYSAKDVIESFTVLTEWVFDQSCDEAPHAYINGIDMCPGHSTTHVIDYHIATTNNWSFDRSSNCYYIDFSMQLQRGSSASSSSYPVVQRCWIGASSYAGADTDRKAEAGGVCGDIAYFRATVDRSTGDKKVSPH